MDEMIRSVTYRYLVAYDMQAKFMACAKYD